MREPRGEFCKRVELTANWSYNIHMNNFQKGFSTIFLLSIFALVIAGGVYWSAHKSGVASGVTDMGNGWVTYADPQGTFSFEVPSSLTMYVPTGSDTGKLITGSVPKGMVIFGSTHIITEANKGMITPSNTGKPEVVSIGNTSGLLWHHRNQGVVVNGSPDNANDIEALSGPFDSAGDRLYIDIANVSDSEVSTYEDMLRKIVASTQFNH